MAYKNLADFVNTLEKAGELIRIKAEVSSELEITEIADRISKEVGPALLFENVNGSDMPLLINAMGSSKRMSMALGINNLNEVADKFLDLIPSGFPSSFKDKISSVLKLKQVAGAKPKEVRAAACQEIVLEGDDIDLTKLPVLKCWPDDGGKFITLPMVITKDPNSGLQNMGMYRMQIYDKNTTGMHWHIHHTGAQHYRKNQKKGVKTEVAVALGGDPAIIYSATAPVPPGFDELLLAGMLRGKPVEVVKAKTVDLVVPAESEIILEGYVEPNETRLEGPFGDHTGYYSLADQYPVFHLTAITHRKKPIYPTTIVGRPPMEDCYMAKATERLFLPAVKAVIPEVVDMNLPFEGVFHNCVLISIDKQFPKHAKKVMDGIWGLGQMMFSKAIVVVDKQVDVQNASEVAWKVFNNIDPARDIYITEGPLDTLDHSSNTPYYGSKVGLDATIKTKDEGHDRQWPDDIVMSKIVKDLVTKRWSEYGFK
ncbi:MAG: menaquinone biosynthesis decarboxylase [Actinobacteria bacterium]|nr:MAG: menaquinone biosynthesis decarboxylase [Actinomycetota bacterium]